MRLLWRLAKNKSKAPKKEKAVTLEQVLWNCCVALCGFCSFEKNINFVISLAFLKFSGANLKNTAKKSSRNTELFPYFW